MAVPVTVKFLGTGGPAPPPQAADRIAKTTSVKQSAQRLRCSPDRGAKTHPNNPSGNKEANRFAARSKGEGREALSMSALKVSVEEAGEFAPGGIELGESEQVGRGAGPATTQES